MRDRSRWLVVAGKSATLFLVFVTLWKQREIPISRERERERERGGLVIALITRASPLPFEKVGHSLYTQPHLTRINSGKQAQENEVKQSG